MLHTDQGFELARIDKLVVKISLNNKKVKDFKKLSCHDT